MHVDVFADGRFPGVSTSSAPKARSRTRRSSLMVSGMVSKSLYPITGRMASLSGRRDYPEILDGRRAITVDNALRLARFLGTTAEFWLNYPLRSVRKCPRSFDFMILHAIS